MTGLFDLSVVPSGLRLNVRTGSPQPGARLRISGVESLGMNDVADGPPVPPFVVLALGGNGHASVGRVGQLGV
ncbi:MAG: hypothetical protein JWQ99_1624 [Blastococcus sp.]|nr:hypothetical protein [Blastococcus sp.]